MIVTQAQQVNAQNQQLTRNVVISQPMQVLMQENGAQVIKYEIIQHESRNSIEWGEALLSVFRKDGSQEMKKVFILKQWRFLLTLY